MSTPTPAPVLDGYGHRMKPSDAVRWDYNRDGSRVSLRSAGPAFVLFDRTETERKVVHDSQWHAVITYDPDAAAFLRQHPQMSRYTQRHPDVSGIPGLDTDVECWTLWTQGEAKGGRRYRYCLSMIEAQKIALAWLDRRYALVGTGR